jgi:hypothetical protein
MEQGRTPLPRCGKGEDFSPPGVFEKILSGAQRSDGRLRFRFIRLVGLGDDLDHRDAAGAAGVCQPVPGWVLGGGTGLMILTDHRLSRDIDAFIDDSQYLALLSPETTDVCNCSAWDRAAHYLKLKYPGGEVDFIVTAAISSLPPIEMQVDLTGIRKGWKPTLRIEPPVKIAL